MYALRRTSRHYAAAQQLGNCVRLCSACRTVLPGPDSRMRSMTSTGTAGANKISLRRRATEIAQQRGLLRRLDTLGDQAQAEIFGEPGDRADDGAGGGSS